jgi:hypothetical protein
MHIQHYLPPSPRLRRHWRLALVIVLLVGLFLPQPAHAAPTWINAASLNTPRYYHTATLLPSGKVLVAGGWGWDYLASAEVYDPSAHTWTPTATAMNTARAIHTATLLPSGKVLVAGGYNSNSGGLNSAEVYDPSANTWATVASLNSARYYHTATLLPSGKVLVAGGRARGGSSLNSAELYDPSANTWTTVTPLNTGRYSHTATLLPSGKVLVAGSDSGGSLNRAEVYDPSADTWTTVASLNTGRHYHTATLLPSGQVLVAGGQDIGGGYPTSAELYDRGLGFEEVWRPTVNTVTSPLTLGNALALPGSGYRGFQFEEASGGGTNNSATNYPLVQIRRLDNEQWLWVLPSAFNNLSFTSLPVTNIPAGPALVTVFVNGIPSTSQPLNLNYATSAALNAPSIACNANGIVTVTVSSNEAIPAGVVTLSVDSGAPTAQNLAPVYGSSPHQATATFTLTTPSVGSHPLSASYAAQANFAASSASGTLNVNQAATTTALVSSPNPSTFGQSVTFTATVAPTSGSATPNGMVKFKDGATTLGTSALSGGIATFSTAALAAGTHTLTAEYSGVTNFSTSTGTLAGGQVVNQAATTTSVASSQNPSTFGQPVTFTATVASGAGTPTGTVTFKDGETTLGTDTLSGGIATFSTASLAAGTHTLTAEYRGDTNFVSGTGTLAGGQVVDRAATTTTLVSSPNPSTFGQTVTFTATVASGAGTPTGTVTFKDGATTLGTGELSGGIAHSARRRLRLGRTPSPPSTAALAITAAAYRTRS